jgi:hypothetical protein
MKHVDIEEMIANSRKLVVSLIQPDGDEETYCYLVDTPGLCSKVTGDTEEMVDFDFIPEWVNAAVYEIIKP